MYAPDPNGTNFWKSNSAAHNDDPQEDDIRGTDGRASRLRKARAAGALNLRDRGCNVVVGVRDGGGTIERARDDGFTPTSVAAAVAVAEVAAVLVPDMAQPTAAGASALRRQQRGDRQYRGLTDRSV